MARPDLQSLLDGTHARWGASLALTLYGLIAVSVIAIALETLPDLPPALDLGLRVVEAVILGIFAIEYALRIFAAPQPWRYATSFWGIVDFLAIVPAVVFLFPDMAALRALRLLRLARLLKFLRLSTAMDRIGRAIVDNRDELFIFTYIAAVVLFLAATGIYHFEHHDQPEAFSSIPASLWWAIATLSTVGYGDVYPVTTGGRVFTGLVLLIGIGVIAVPAGLITAALLDSHPTPSSDPTKTATNTEKDP